MKTGLNIWIYFLILAGLSACDTKQDWFDSGISSPYAVSWNIYRRTQLTGN